jgi:hypothetical protein
MTHPLTLHALTALWALQSARGAIDGVIRDEAVQRTPIGPPAGTQTRSSGSLATFGQLLHQERLDRVQAQQQGITQIGASPAPVRAELLDAERVALEAVVDAAWLVASALRRRPLLVYGAAWALWRADEWSRATAYLRLALPHCPPAGARDALEVLDSADAAVRSATRLDRPRRLVPGNPPCPRCHQRMLRIETSAPRRSDRVVVCTARCSCRGEDCTCGMEVRAAGVRHIWPLAQAWQPAGQTRVAEWLIEQRQATQDTTGQGDPGLLSVA